MITKQVKANQDEFLKLLGDYKKLDEKLKMELRDRPLISEFKQM
jgi:hypothetical protein